MTANRAFLVLALWLTAVAGCTARPPGLNLTPASYAELPGWAGDRHSLALPALARSCPAMIRGRDTARIGRGGFAGKVGDWKTLCAALKKVKRGDDAIARGFFEKWFAPFAAADGGDPDGLFTGYFEPELRGSRKRGGAYSVPIYLRPKNLVTVDLGRFAPRYRGRRIVGRVVDGSLVPFPTRRQIERGALVGKGLELVWADNPVDVFFLHIQGSGRVVMTDGSILRLGYDATNGHKYTAIGRDLIARGEIALEEMSMQAIRAWLDANPGKANSLMARNESYIFFRLREGEGPFGAQAVMLTPGRSLAVDRRFVPYGLPIWLDTTDPLDPGQKLRRLVVAQDTGGAIRGPVRGDLYWGSGRMAGEKAGRMRQTGRYFLLVPRAAAAPKTS